VLGPQRPPLGRSHGSGSRLGGALVRAAGCPGGTRSHRRGRCRRSRARGRDRGWRSGWRARQGVGPRRSLRGTTGDAREDGVLDVNACRHVIQAARHPDLCDREGLQGPFVRSVRQPDVVRREGEVNVPRWAPLGPRLGPPWPSRHGLQVCRIAIFAELGAEQVADLAERDVLLHRGEDRRHHVLLVVSERGTDVRQRASNGVRIPLGTE